MRDSHTKVPPLSERQGYDGSTLNIGSPIELHPGCDMWMRGARYGQVKGFSGKRVIVQLDKIKEGRYFIALPSRMRVKE